jgi:hypothetical protein
MESRRLIIAAALLIGLGAVLWFNAWLAWALAISCLAVAAVSWWKERSIVERPENVNQR